MADTNYSKSQSLGFLLAVRSSRRFCRVVALLLVLVSLDCFRLVSSVFFNASAEAAIQPLASNQSFSPLTAQYQSAKQTHYVLKYRGKTIGNLVVSKQLSKTAPGMLTTRVKSFTPLNRNGERFDSQWESVFTEPLTANSHQAKNFVYQSSLGDESLSRIKGTVDDQTIRVYPDQTFAIPNVLETGSANVSDVGSDVLLKHSAEAALSGDRFVFPVGPSLEQLFKERYQAKTNQPFAYQTLDLAVSPTLVNAQAVCLSEREEKIKVGPQSVATKRFSIINPANPKATPVIEWRNAQGQLIQALDEGSETQLMLAVQSTDKYFESKPSYALTKPIDTLLDTTIASSPIRYPRKMTKGVVKITAIRGASPSVLNAFVLDNRQRLEKDSRTDSEESASPAHIILNVEQDIPEDNSVEYPIPFDDEYLKPNSVIDSQNVYIVHTAKQIVEAEPRAYVAALKLRDWVNERIRHKTMDVAFASASQTLQSQEGDCTEHAVLLAALLRSLGIPARVAVGLIYQPQEGSEFGQFVFHMWTEAYIAKSQWVALDATMAEHPVDATHLKIADSSLANPSDWMRLTQKVSALTGRIRIDVVQSHSPNEGVFDLSGQADSTKLSIPKIDLNEIDIKTLSKDQIKNYTITPPAAGMSLDTADGLVAYGIQKLDQGDYPTAVRAFSKASTKIPARSTAAIDHYQLGKKLLSVEMYGLSYQSFQRAAQLDSSITGLISRWLSDYFPAQTLDAETEQLFLEGVRLQNQGDLDGAMSAFQSVLQSVSTYAPAQLHLADIAYARQQWAAALSYYQRYSALKNQDPRGLLGLAKTNVAQARFASAVPYYRQALSLVQSANASVYPYTKALSKTVAADLAIAQAMADLSQNPKLSSAWSTLGKSYLSKNQSDKALDAFNNALKVAPTSADALAGRFQIALNRSDWLVLQKLYPALLSKATAQPALLSLLGQYEMRTRQYSRATQHLNQAISLQSNLANAYDTLSQIYLRLAELEQNPQYQSRAIQTLQQGVSATGQKILKEALAKLIVDNNPAQANRLVSELMTADPLTSVEPNPALVVLKVKTLMRLADENPSAMAEAEALLKKALMVSPYDTDLLAVMGDFSMQEELYQQAGVFYQKALKADSANVHANNRLRDAIAKHHLSIREPDYLWQLSDDEKAYLVQDVVWQKNYVDMMLTFHRKLNPLLEQFGNLSVIANENRQLMVPVLEQFLQKTKSYYQLLQKQNPPARLSFFKQFYLQHLYHDTQVAQVNLECMPRLLNYQSVHNEDCTQKQMELMQAFAQIQQMPDPMDNIAPYLPQALLKVLDIESDIEALEPRTKELIALKKEALIAMFASNSEDKEAQAVKDSMIKMLESQDKIDPKSVQALNEQMQKYTESKNKPSASSTQPR